MKNIDTTAKFDFKKTTVTVFSKPSGSQGKYGENDYPTVSSGMCTVVRTSGIFTESLGI